MRIVVTGGCGFIGSHFILKMINRGHRVLNIDKRTYAAQCNLFDINEYLSFNRSYAFKLLDICEIGILAEEINTFEPDCLVHFAAETHVDNSILGPESFIDTNIKGTFNLLEVSSKYFSTKKTFKFIHISTDEVYGSLGIEGKFNEQSCYDPKSPYAASKASSDHLVKSWSHTYGLPCVITHCSNNYGPHQHQEKFIPKIIKNCLDGKEIPVYGSGTNIRDWIYVEDHCSAIDLIMNSKQTNCVYDIGANEEHDNNFIANKICTIMDDLYPRPYKYSDLITYTEDRPGHDFRYAIDSSKIRSELAWSPTHKFEDAILNTVSWYLDRYHP